MDSHTSDTPFPTVTSMYTSVGLCTPDSTTDRIGILFKSTYQSQSLRIAPGWQNATRESIPIRTYQGWGVVVAFLLSTYLVLALILGAYCFGALPEGLVRRPDRQLFFARRPGPNERWQRIFEEVVLIFSDQQLLTGIGVLVAGYVQVVNADLSAYHWNSVVYLAWLSSTVHLMSLSVLRGRLKRNKLALTVRICAIMLVFILLVAALWPTTMIVEHPATPVRCQWIARKIPTVGSSMNTFVSYLTLVGTFFWKLGQFPDRSRGWLHFWGRAWLECAMETAARHSLQTRLRTPWSMAKYRAITTFYVIFVAHMELLESFMFTITLLAYTLVWGTVNLTQRTEVTYPYGLESFGGELDEAEKEMGFGQILALLLLAQPVLAALDTLNSTVAPFELDVPSTVANMTSGQRRIPALGYTAAPTSAFQEPPAAKSRTLSEMIMRMVSTSAAMPMVDSSQHPAAVPMTFRARPGGRRWESPAAVPAQYEKGATTRRIAYGNRYRGDSTTT
ncbi:hypothetical protein PG997_000275 [Apiospora hydei]|uniref:Uncharacterized protein n=1 Tax=Apiospora hydei TaxID=1337664 RepID=A0ABR1XA57_9PEZI